MSMLSQSVSPSHDVAMILVMVAVTAALRFLPFLIFSGKKTPPLITELGQLLPYAIMGMLVVYCLKGADFTQFPHALPELVSCAVVVALHLWKRSTILSIAGGTICYMALVQLVF